MVIDMIKKLKLKEIVGIRGLALHIDDIDYEEDTVDTVMYEQDRLWNIHLKNRQSLFQ